MKKSTLIDINTRKTVRHISEETLAKYNENKAYKVADIVAHENHETKNSYRAKARKQKLNIAKTKAYLESANYVEEVEEAPKRDLLDRYNDEQLLHLMNEFGVQTIAELDDVMMHDNVR